MKGENRNTGPEVVPELISQNEVPGGPLLKACRGRLGRDTKGDDTGDILGSRTDATLLGGTEQHRVDRRTAPDEQGAHSLGGIDLVAGY